ncbi:CsbD family protein [Actinokineospora sp. PR83]|uniref:CsbD family protein n=1 Tax=Actinokineospora sp. PR83 TaxID=2884908 RepID=UPI001F40FA63|nr:CsbD family protein [Actinokineospora sp. PR83]MCG8914766.1 CsbD family protein [Actinokineospora sp. PR83]
MSVFDKAKDKAEQVVGEVKEKLGQATDNRDLENAGKKDQVTGQVKESGHDLRDKAAGAVHDAQDRLSGRG